MLSILHFFLGDDFPIFTTCLPSKAPSPFREWTGALLITQIHCIDRIIQHIPIPVEILRIGRVGNDTIRLDKVVDIRRNRELHGKKNRLLKFRYFEIRDILS